MQRSAGANINLDLKSFEKDLMNFHFFLIED
jgi:hypothetical protein